MIPRFCDEDGVGLGVKDAWDDHFPGEQHGAQADAPNRSRRGTEPISVRNRTDLGAELDRSRRGGAAARTCAQPGRKWCLQALGSVVQDGLNELHEAGSTSRRVRPTMAGSTRTQEFIT